MSSPIQLAWSMLAQLQRREIQALAETIGVQPIFLKAVWADEVLFNGTGSRSGGDIDVLIAPDRFREFAKVLTGAGYSRVRVASHKVTSDIGDKEWLFRKAGAFLPIDLHRGLSEHFPSATKPFLQRVKEYPAANGSIWSLVEEDQVLYCVMHYMGHRFELDERHLADISALAAKHPLDWDVIRRRAEGLSLQIPMALLVEALRNRGASAPPPQTFAVGRRLESRLAWARSWIAVDQGFSRVNRSEAKWQLYLDLLYRFPRLKAKPLDSVRTAVKYVGLRIADVLIR